MYSRQRMKLIFLTFICFISSFLCHAIESDLTIDLLAGKRECFHQHVAEGKSMDIEYQVIEGGDLDINFVVQSPDGRPIITELRKTDGVHKVEATSGGDYMFCLDNTFSRFSNKLVFFEVLTDDPDPNWPKLEEIQNQAFADQPDEVYEMKVEDIKAILDSVKTNIAHSISAQNMIKIHEARDRNTQENNFVRVNFWSAIQLFVMLSVGLTQVLLIRGLFTETKTKGSSIKIRT